MMVALILTLAVVLGSGSQAIAADPDFEEEFPAGIACEFPLKVEGFGGNQVLKVFTDEHGTLVRSISAGKGSLLTFTNLDTGETLSLTTGGSVTQLTVNPDGTSTFMGTGHNVIILFPTDEPEGPSTILYQGRIVFTVDLNTGVGTVQTVNARQTDICAALAD
jgi:hypothetical protein